MSRMTGFSSPLMLGFEDLERVLDRANKTSNDGYPPYNIERITEQADGAEEVLRITLAVAGFAEEDLEITTEEKQLTIRGKQEDDPDRVYLHRGIAARQFQRSFVLADGIEVRDAALNNGLLEINLIRLEPERVVRRIKIKS